MSQDHKQALLQGRKEAKAIKAYLATLQQKRPGRPATRESLEAKLADLTKRVEKSEDPLATVKLIQARIDTKHALEQLSRAEDFDRLTADFVANVASYSERKGISYTAWREFGVPAVTLREGGIKQTRNP